MIQGKDSLLQALLQKLPVRCKYLGAIGLQTSSQIERNTTSKNRQPVTWTRTKRHPAWKF